MTRLLMLTVDAGEAGTSAQRTVLGRSRPVAEGLHSSSSYANLNELKEALGVRDTSSIGVYKRFF